MSSLCRYSSPSDAMSGNPSPSRYNVRLTLGSGVITAMLVMNCNIHDVTYLLPLISADPAIVASCSDSAGVAEQRQRPGLADREEARGLGPARTVAAAAETSRQGKINRATRAQD